MVNDNSPGETTGELALGLSKVRWKEENEFETYFEIKLTICFKALDVGDRGKSRIIRIFLT